MLTCRHPSSYFGGKCCSRVNNQHDTIELKLPQLRFPATQLELVTYNEGNLPHPLAEKKRGLGSCSSRDAKTNTKLPAAAKGAATQEEVVRHHVCQAPTLGCIQTFLRCLPERKQHIHQFSTWKDMRWRPQPLLLFMFLLGVSTLSTAIGVTGRFLS